MSEPREIPVPTLNLYKVLAKLRRDRDERRRTRVLERIASELEKRR